MTTTRTWQETERERLEQLLTKLADRHLGIETLEWRGHGSLDFHEVGVCGVKKALRQAYLDGMRNAIRGEVVPYPAGRQCPNCGEWREQMTERKDDLMAHCHTCDAEWLCEA